ncbi:MAG: phosphoribosylformylglycinamidine cyclo-ligase, partial [Clostridia bacterium]|nr:phosphoribosylformylglycinamidine cyclo-ligase [Clostridia bacterium]
APVAAFGGKTLGETLLAPTKIYVKPVLALMDKITVKGVSHITGGGFYENIPRSIPDGLCAAVEKAAVKTPPVFAWIAENGGVSERDMFNTYNMGVGMCLTVAAADADLALSVLRENGEDAYVIGRVERGEEKVRLW